MMSNDQMVFPASWEEFRGAGLLWWVNRTLHLFGWAIVTEVNEDGSVGSAYPARVRFRGFGEDSETRGFENLTEHLDDEMDRIRGDVFADDSSIGKE